MLQCEFFNDAGVDKVRYGYDLSQGATVVAVAYLREKDAPTYRLIRKRYEAFVAARTAETEAAEVAIPAEPEVAQAEEPATASV